MFNMLNRQAGLRLVSQWHQFARPYFVKIRLSVSVFSNVFEKLMLIIHV